MTDDSPSSWTLPFTAVLVVGFVVSIVTVGRASFSLDESVSASLAKAPWHLFTQTVVHRESNMALYYLALRLWDGVVGGVTGTALGPEAVARSLSVAASVGAVAVVMCVTRRLFDRRTALVCGLLLAVDPLVVTFAQDARGYALSLLLVSASSALFVRGIRAPSGALSGAPSGTLSGVSSGRGLLSGWGLWVAYALVSGLAAYANFWAALVPVAHGVSLAFLPPGTAPWRRLVPTAVGLGVLLTPLALLIHATDSSGVNWAAGSSAGKVISTIRGDLPHAVIDLAALAGVALVVVLVVMIRRRTAVPGAADHWPVLFTTSWLVVPLAAVVLLSLTYKPLLVLRYLVICLPPLVMLVSFGLTRLEVRRRTVARGAAAVLVVLSVLGLGALVGHGSPQDWRGAVASVTDRAEPGDGVVVFAPYTRIPFQWYVTRSSSAAALHPLFPAGAWSTDPLRYDSSITATAGGIEADVGGTDRVWLVQSQQGLYPAQESAVIAGLRRAGLVPAGTRDFHGVRVTLYTRA